MYNWCKSNNPLQPRTAVKIPPYLKYDENNQNSLTEILIEAVFNHDGRLYIATYFFASDIFEIGIKTHLPIYDHLPNQKEILKYEFK